MLTDAQLCSVCRIARDKIDSFSVVSASFNVFNGLKVACMMHACRVMLKCGI